MCTKPKNLSGHGNHGMLVGFSAATRPEESAHPELWEGLSWNGGVWHHGDGGWSLDFDGE